MGIYPSERAVHDRMNGSEGEYAHLVSHVERYVWAMRYVLGKTVADAACGTRYGTWLLSMGAKHIHAVDYHPDAFEHEFHFCCPVTNICMNLDNWDLPEVDVVVSFETIEHVQDPVGFLGRIKASELLWSIPVKVRSRYHVTNPQSYQEVVKLLGDGGWRISGLSHRQAGRGPQEFYYGVARR